MLRYAGSFLIAAGGDILLSLGLGSSFPFLLRVGMFPVKKIIPGRLPLHFILMHSLSCPCVRYRVIGLFLNSLMCFFGFPVIFLCTTGGMIRGCPLVMD